LQWLVICSDVAASAALRRKHLQAHLTYIESVMDRISVAGPLFAGTADDMNGSCFIYRTDDLGQARTLLHNDPYYQAGLYSRTEFIAFKPVAGIWMDGAAWKKSAGS